MSTAPDPHAFPTEVIEAAKATNPMARIAEWKDRLRTGRG